MKNFTISTQLILSNNTEEYYYFKQMQAEQFNWKFNIKLILMLSLSLFALHLVFFIKCFKRLILKMFVP